MNFWRTLPTALRGFLLATIAGLLLYLPLRSIQWDTNGIVEARATEVGVLVSPNHLLYRPVLAVLDEAVKGFGLHAPFATPDQVFTAVLSALGLGAFFVAVYFLTRRVAAAALATALYATTWSYWVFSTDIYYITLAAAFAAGALALVAFPARAWWGTAAAAVFTALAVLTWQANIFLVPALALLYFARTRRVKPVLVYAGCALALVGGVYLAVGILVMHLYTVSALAGWLLSHSSDGGGRLGLWGVWSVSRIRPLLLSAVASFIPLWEGLRLRALLQGRYALEYVPRLLAVVAMLAIPALTVWRVWQKQVEYKLAMAVALGMAALLPFIVWWDPYEPKWFVVPNLFLLGAAAILWARAFVRRDYIVVGVCVAVIAFANFSATILPRHTVPNPNLAMAACVAQQAHANDAVVVTQWGWFDYAHYFYSYQGQTISVIGKGNTAGKMARVKQAITTTSAQNGRVYMRDLEAMSDVELASVKALTGLDGAAFGPFAKEAGFECQGQKFVVIR